MKLLMLSLTMFLAIHLAVAQAPNHSEAIRQEMKKISYMAGKWKGEASVRQPNGASIKVNQTEDVQFKLDGTIMLVEGIGRNPGDDKLVFNAMAVISFNPYTKEFKLKSHTMEGNQTEAYFKVLEENHFEWGFETPQKAKIKYDILLNPQDKSWIEKGDYSPDGTAWYPFIEMKLTKLD